ncbi:hypothetical protein BX666DRAFT_153002 [Dichotomocladium elegans]|nr:hypothetical protein BX666DRAFT_153002 [Dichotomocladium elegans]
MTKEAFIAHTKILDGGENISSEVLDIMYDNVVSAEFNFAARENHAGPSENEDQVTTWTSWAYRLLWMEPNTFNNHTSYQTTLTEDTRVRLMELMPEKNTLHYTRRNIMDLTTAHVAFCHTRPICLAGVRSKSSSQKPMTYIAHAAKTGILDCKQDLLSGGRRSTMRGWHSCGVALTNSQFLLFNDFTTLAAWADGSSFTATQEQRHRHLLPHFLSLSSASVNASSLTASAIVASNPLNLSIVHRPRQAISLECAVCIYDESYSKYPHVFRLIARDGQELLLRAKNNADMDDWMTKINYAATQKTLSVYLRPLQTRHFEYLKETTKSLELAQDVFRGSLERTLQLRRNLMTLAPIQRSSKERMLLYAEMIGKQLHSKRIMLEKIACYSAFCQTALSSPFSERVKSEPVLSLGARDNMTDFAGLLRRRSRPSEGEGAGANDSMGCDVDEKRDAMSRVPSTEHRPRSGSYGVPEQSGLRVIKMRGRSRSSANLAPSVYEDGDISIFDDDEADGHNLIGRP